MAVEPRVEPTSPVVWWAAIGAAFALLIAYLLVRYLLSGPRSVDPGPTPIPQWMLITIRSVEIASIVVFLWVVWAYIVKPWRATRRLTFDALFTLACGTLIWQDFLQNYTQIHAVWNAHLVNLGSWYEFIPGWMSPNSQNMVESPLFAATWYPAILLLLVVGTNKVMWMAKARWPRLGAGGLFLIACLAGAIMDAILDPLYVRLGLYSWAGAVKSWTLWYGHYYQFPLYEIPTIAIWFGATASIRFFMDDKGYSFVERGIERVAAGAKTKTWLRFLALTGVLNLFFFGFYCLPLGVIATHASTVPPDIQKRSYFTNGMCGDGTSYACPGGAVPISKPGSAHLSPDGKLIVPRGVRLPRLVPFDR
jgi:uncharacterized protein DUF5135